MLNVVVWLLNIWPEWRYPPNSAQLDGTPYHSSKLDPGPCSSVGMWRGQTDTRGHRRA